jgi:hypothetical protein
MSEQQHFLVQCTEGIQAGPYLTRTPLIFCPQANVQLSADSFMNSSSSTQRRTKLAKISSQRKKREPHCMHYGNGLSLIGAK